jgi:hypothetical protein
VKRDSLAGARSGCAHSGQNFAVVETWLPQFGHVRASGAAHSSQNFAPDRFSCRHFEHFIRAPSGDCRSRVTSVASRTNGNNAYVQLLPRGAALVDSGSKREPRECLIGTCSPGLLLPHKPTSRHKGATQLAPAWRPRTSPVINAVRTDANAPCWPRARPSPSPSHTWFRIDNGHHDASRPHPPNLSARRRLAASRPPISASGKAGSQGDPLVNPSQQRVVA